MFSKTFFCSCKDTQVEETIRPTNTNSTNIESGKMKKNCKMNYTSHYDNVFPKNHLSVSLLCSV